MSINQSIYENTFAIYKNLMFYNGFSTSNVYFKSLDKFEGKTEEYNNARLKVISDLDKGRMSFFSQNSQGNLFKNTGNIQEGKFMQCINFLKKAIDYEMKNEIEFFNLKLEELKKSFNNEDLQKIPEVQQLIDIFNASKKFKGYQTVYEEIIDYDKFLASVNSLLRGIKETKTTVEYEKARIEQINDALKTMHNNRERQLEGLAFKWGKNQDWIDEHLQAYDDEIKAYYIKNKNFSSKYDKYGKVYERLTGATTAFSDVPKEIANALAEWIRKQADHIFENKEIVDTIVNYVRIQNIIVPNYKEQIAEMTKSIIIQALVNIGKQHIKEILYKKYRRIPKKDIINELEKSIDITQTYHIDGYYQNSFIFGKHLKGFKELDEDFDLHEASSEEFMEMFKRFHKAIKQSEEKQYKLREEQESLRHFMDKESIYEEFKDLIILIEQLQNLDKKLRKKEREINRKLITQSQDVKLELGNKKKKETVSITVHITPNGVFMDDWDQKIKSLESFQRIFGEDSKMKLSTVKNTISTITGNASKALRERLATAVDKAIDGVSSSESNALNMQLVTMIRDGLQDLHVSVKGPDLQEILDIIDFKIHDKSAVSAARTGQKKIKNDTITISINSKNLHFSTDISTLITNSNKQLAEIITSNITDNEIEEQLQTNVIRAFQASTTKAFERNNMRQGRYSENGKAFLDSFHRFQERKHNVSTEYNKVLDDWDTYQKRLIKNGADEKTIRAKYEKIINSLKDSFYISNTVKAYNQYNNKVGFGGGSIGGTLDLQLANIADIFQLAGMPMSKSDQEWLRYLIINCGPQMYAGEKNKPQLEQYLGSMAAFMLFDEGGAEARILRRLPEDIEVIKSAPKILHLYSVNGVYVTGSYVLKQVLSTLELCLKMFNNIPQASYRGAGVRIINNMKESMIPNRKGKITDTNPWETVAKKANTNVSIEIFFLAGLLGVINGINDQMSNIEITT